MDKKVWTNTDPIKTDDLQRWEDGAYDLAAHKEDSTAHSGVFASHNADTNAHKTLFDDVKSSITALHDNVDDNWNQTLAKETDIRKSIKENQDNITAALNLATINHADISQNSSDILQLQQELVVLDVNGNIDKLLDKTIESVTTSVTKIPDNAFNNCTKLSYFSGENVTVIGNSAFRNCPALSTVKLSSSITAESGTLHIPSGMTVKHYAFGGCLGFNKLIIDEGVTFSGELHFDRCGFTEVQLPGDMTEIKKYMFRYLPAKVLDLPASVVKLHDQCLRYSSIEQLIIRHEGDVINMVNQDVLWESAISKGNGYIYVPDDLVEDYKSATNWSTYASKIKTISELEAAE